MTSIKCGQFYGCVVVKGKKNKTIRIHSSAFDIEIKNENKYYLNIKIHIGERISNVNFLCVYFKLLLCVLFQLTYEHNHKYIDTYNI